jgi:hypothetical protein
MKTMCICLENLNFGKVKRILLKVDLILKSKYQVYLFNLIDKIPIENLHLSFCKYVLGIRKKASNLELGKLTVESDRM